MSEGPPRRFKEESELSGDEVLATIQAEGRGAPPPRFETDAYKQARRAALEAAGLEPEDEPERSPDVPDVKVSSDPFGIGDR